jgi:hypothetical protein
MTKCLREISGYDRNIATVCVTHHSMLYPQVHLPCFYGWEAIKQDKKKKMSIQQDDWNHMEA